jgi:hypothetical protein
MESNGIIPTVCVSAKAGERAHRRKEVTEENFGFLCSFSARTEARWAS